MLPLQCEDQERKRSQNYLIDICKYAASVGTEKVRGWNMLYETQWDTVVFFCCPVRSWHPSTAPNIPLGPREVLGCESDEEAKVIEGHDLQSNQQSLYHCLSSGVTSFLQQLPTLKIPIR